ncbi:MAG: GNAT family N-acetyltransferase [Anaerolineae bacterium]|nr:GNAT family N-acetyltransferase [Anaerolineae bacterium]
MNIRPAVASDYVSVDPILVEVEHLHVALEPSVFQTIDHYDPSHFHHLIDADDSIILLAEEEKFIVGAVIAVIREWPEVGIFRGGRYVAVEEISVTESARGKGIGRALMGAVESWADKHRIHEIQLSVWDSNPGAIVFYHELGFQPFLHHYRKSLPSKE